MTTSDEWAEQLGLKPRDAQAFVHDVALHGYGFVKRTTDGATHVPLEDVWFLAEDALMKTYGETDRVIAEIRAERNRQINDKGWTAEHDDGHSRGELSAAAACYALGSKLSPEEFEMLWPWHGQDWNPGIDRCNLIKAAALIVAEIERLDRAWLEKNGPKLHAALKVSL